MLLWMIMVCVARIDERLLTELMQIRSVYDVCLRIEKRYDFRKKVHQCFTVSVFEYERGERPPFRWFVRERVR
jgi:hypothetical protein